MKERPILFSAPMVRAILAGHKTQTRRVVKPQPYVDDMGNFCWNGRNFGQDFNGPHIQAIASPIPSSKTKRVLCPHGKPRDQLWVRETFWYDDEDGSIIYRADGDTGIVDTNKHETGLARFNWRPSIFMPRAASRITLEITGVRVERLQEITRGDCMAEGCPFPNIAKTTDPRGWFSNLWQTINGPGSWEINPWVWVIEFRRVEPH